MQSQFGSLSLVAQAYERELRADGRDGAGGEMVGAWSGSPRRLGRTVRVWQRVKSTDVPRHRLALRPPRVPL